jgi:hypothetical protein
VNADDVGYGTEWLRSCRKEVSENGSRVAELVNWWLKGIYHAQADVLRADWSGDYVILTLGRWHNLSTYDFDGLTRLVVGAHDAAIRVQIEPCNPRYLRVSFHPRKRHGRGPESHPTLEGRMATWSGRLPQYMDPNDAEAERRAGSVA